MPAHYSIHSIAGCGGSGHQQFIQIQTKTDFILFVKHFCIVCTQSQICRNKFFLGGIIGIPDFGTEVRQNKTKGPSFLICQLHSYR